MWFMQVQIVTKKIDLSHVTSKCGSLKNIRHRPGKSVLSNSLRDNKLDLGNGQGNFVAVKYLIRRTFPSPDIS